MLQPDTSLWIWGTFLPANCPLGLINDFWIAVGIWWTISGWRTATKTWTQITNCRIFQLKKNQKETGANYLSLKTKKMFFTVSWVDSGKLMTLGSPLLLIFSLILIKEVNVALYLKLWNCLCHRIFFSFETGSLWSFGFNFNFSGFSSSVPFLTVLICFSHLVGIFLLLAARWFHRVFVNRSHEIFPLLFQSKLTNVPGDSSVGIHIK